MRALSRGAVLGHPVGHSKSPALHHAAYAALGLDYSYTARDVTEAQLPEVLAELRRGGWYGLSVTMPLKNRAAALVDELSPVARSLGSVNTIVVGADDAGRVRLLGENTDVAGIVNALRHAGARPTPRCAILGAGGTAVAAVAAIAALGGRAADVFVRTLAKGAGVLAVAAELGVPARLCDFGTAGTALAGYDVVISTLPPHGADSLAGSLTLPAALNGAALLDVAYDPWPSALASRWAAAGGTVVPGIEMLLYQGLEQVKLFAVAGGHGPRLAGRDTDILDVMCDALALQRRPAHDAQK